MVHILIVFTIPISISIPPFVPVDSKTLDVPDDIYTVVSDCSYYLISPQKKKACENYHFSSSLDARRSRRDSNSSVTTREDDHGGVNHKDYGGGDDRGQSRVIY